MLVGLHLYLSFQTSTKTEVAITQDTRFIRNQAWVNQPNLFLHSFVTVVEIADMFVSLSFQKTKEKESVTLEGVENAIFTLFYPRNTVSECFFNRFILI